LRLRSRRNRIETIPGVGLAIDGDRQDTAAITAKRCAAVLIDILDAADQRNQRIDEIVELGDGYNIDGTIDVNGL